MQRSKSSLIIVASKGITHFALRSVATPPRLPPDVFGELKYLPDPMSGGDGHYKSFQCIWN